jgi:hypothetical protein
MVTNSTKITKTNNHLSPSLTEHTQKKTDFCFLLDQHAKLDVHSASSMKQHILHVDMSLHLNTLSLLRLDQS